MVRSNVHVFWFLVAMDAPHILRPVGAHEPQQWFYYGRRRCPRRATEQGYCGKFGNVDDRGGSGGSASARGLGSQGQQVSYTGYSCDTSHLTRCRPVVLRTADPKFTHVGQLWQALYYVPQVLHRISQYRGPPPPEGVTEVDPPTTGIGIPQFMAQKLH